MIILDNNRNPIGEYYTDKDGRIEYKEPKKNMPYYYVKESQPAKNYYRNYNEYASKLSAKGSLSKIALFTSFTSFIAAE